MERWYHIGIMKEFLKKNFTLLLAFALPILLIIVVVITTYLPSLFIKTNYDFVYLTCSENGNYYMYNCGSYLQKKYSVVNDAIVVNKIDTTQEANKDFKDGVYSERIFLHDTETNESREISLKDAQALKLSNLLTSPDGITVSSDYDRVGGDFFLFGGYSSYGHYLTKGKSKLRINLINDSTQNYYNNNFQFLGWVL